MAAKTATELGLATGKWTIDPVHSQIGFSARHMMVSKVRGYFTEFSGDVEVAEDLTQSTVSVTIQAVSITTRQTDRDNHVRSSDFLDVENHPTLTFVSKRITPAGSNWELTGDLTIRGVTKETTFDLEFDSVGPDAYGGVRAGLTATTKISRKAFGLEWNPALETGGFVVADEVKLEIEAQIVKA